MKFILIYAIASALGLVSGNAEFDDRAACESAITVMADNLKGSGGICVPKSTEEDAPKAAAPSGSTAIKAPVARK